MMRSSGYNRCGVLMGTSWRASGPRSHRLQGDFSPMITLILLQRAFCATANAVTTTHGVPNQDKGVEGQSGSEIEEVCDIRCRRIDTILGPLAIATAALVQG